MKIKKDFLNRSYSDPNGVTSENLFNDETRTISEEINNIQGDNLTINNGILVTNAGTSNCNGFYVYAGILSGKPYYTNDNGYRLIWSGTRWELQQITPLLVFYYNDTTDDLSSPFYQLNWAETDGTLPVPTFSTSTNTQTIKNIDYIIDSDNQSIDGSDTPMSDANRELVTRDYLDINLQNNSHFTKTGTELEPSDTNVNIIKIDRNHNGYNQVTLENVNTGNGAGAVFEVHNSSTAYQDNMYMGIYSDNFWLSQLAGNGVLMTDQSLVIGTVDVTKSIDFLVGNSYSAPVVVAHLNQDGFHLDALQTTAVHPGSYYNLFVDASNGLIYASNTGAVGNTPQTDTYTLSNVDINTNGYVTLSQQITTDNHNSVNLNGSILFEGAGEDYTVDVGNNRIIFTASQIALLTVSDRLQVKYKY